MKLSTDAMNNTDNTRQKNHSMPKPQSTADALTVVLTIGHSTHPLDEFIHLLQAHGVTRVADVRAVPRSRHNPQFTTGSIQ